MRNLYSRHLRFRSASSFFFINIKRDDLLHKILYYNGAGEQGAAGGKRRILRLLRKLFCSWKTPAKIFVAYSVDKTHVC